MNYLLNILEETLNICQKGYYSKNENTVKLTLSESEMRQCRVFLPDEIESLKYIKQKKSILAARRCRYKCENADSFSLARSLLEQSGHSLNIKSPKILVLNFANPITPGGGARRGARAQEEDLCRNSSLLLSLESSTAEAFYSFNKNCSYLGSNAIVITPQVEIIRDKNNSLLDETAVVSVMTCAAPIISYGLEYDASYEEYIDIFYERISGMLRCAAYLGYSHLVLGAFGCGAFGNDAKVVSDLFYKALKELCHVGIGICKRDIFEGVSFAVLSPSGDSYNYREFYRNFGDNNFYK